jgi:hypothetical protein
MAVAVGAATPDPCRGLALSRWARISEDGQLFEKECDKKLKNLKPFKPGAEFEATCRARSVSMLNVEPWIVAHWSSSAPRL